MQRRKRKYEALSKLSKMMCNSVSKSSKEKQKDDFKVAVMLPVFCVNGKIQFAKQNPKGLYILSGVTCSKDLNISASQDFLYIINTALIFPTFFVLKFYSLSIHLIN